MLRTTPSGLGKALLGKSIGVGLVVANVMQVRVDASLVEGPAQEDLVGSHAGQLERTRRHEEHLVGRARQVVVAVAAVLQVGVDRLARRAERTDGVAQLLHLGPVRRAEPGQLQEDAADAPVDVRTLRSLVMSRLPVMDIYLVPLGGNDDGDDHGQQFEPIDECDTPEQGLLRREAEHEAAGYVDRFLNGLQTTVRGKAKQYNRMLAVLWHCYLSQDHGTQLEVAATLGVSDSLVSDYRRRIEQELRALAFSEIEEARRFEMALRDRVRMLVGDQEK